MYQKDDTKTQIGITHLDDACLDCNVHTPWRLDKECKLEDRSNSRYTQSLTVVIQDTKNDGCRKEGRASDIRYGDKRRRSRHEVHEAAPEVVREGAVDT